MYGADLSFSFSKYTSHQINLFYTFLLSAVLVWLKAETCCYVY
jgi:hypothetical protein